MSEIGTEYGRLPGTFIADGDDGDHVKLRAEESHDCTEVLLTFIDENGNAVSGIFSRVGLTLFVRKIYSHED